MNNEGYVIIFFSPISKEEIYLSYISDISKICYDKNPNLLGTRNINLSKLYESKEDAVKDIYTLRYHHREFLKIKTGIKKTKINLNERLNLNNCIKNYNIDELM